MEEKYYNIVNEYFGNIESVNKALAKLIDYFDSQEEPVIILFFGDHKPYLEEAYNQLNINMNRWQEDGFINYYETPYFAEVTQKIGYSCTKSDENGVYLSNCVKSLLYFLF